MNLLVGGLFSVTADIGETSPPLFPIIPCPERLQICKYVQMFLNETFNNRKPLLKSDMTSLFANLTFVIETKWHVPVLISVLIWYCSCPLPALSQALPYGSLLFSVWVKPVLIPTHRRARQLPGQMLHGWVLCLIWV